MRIWLLIVILMIKLYKMDQQFALCCKSVSKERKKQSNNQTNRRRKADKIQVVIFCCEVFTLCFLITYKCLRLLISYYTQERIMASFSPGEHSLPPLFVIVKMDRRLSVITLKDYYTLRDKWATLFYFASLKYWPAYPFLAANIFSYIFYNHCLIACNKYPEEMGTSPSKILTLLLSSYVSPTV